MEAAARRDEDLRAVIVKGELAYEDATESLGRKQQIELRIPCICTTLMKEQEYKRCISALSYLGL